MMMREVTKEGKKLEANTHHKWSCTYRTPITFRLLNHTVVVAVVIPTAGAARTTTGFLIVVAIAVVVITAAGRL
jgi:hypothetical protein